MRESESRLQAAVQNVQVLPTIDSVGLKIIEVASHPDVSMSELSQAIGQDPSLAARILRIANSPFYGISKQVDSLQLALVVLGLTEARNVALGLTLFSAVKKMGPGLEYEREQFWLHSAGCAMVTRILGQKLNFRGAGTDFIAGLLHDVGKIIIDRYFNSKFVQIFKKTFAHKPPMIEAEQQILGKSHEGVGAWLAEKWRLPETLRDAIAYHHDFPAKWPETGLKDPRLASLSYIAEAFCELHQIGWDGDSGYSDLKDTAAWDVVLSQQSRYTSANIDEILNETLEEFEKARPQALWL